MKKIVALMMAVMMLFTLACAEETDGNTQWNPHDYKLIQVLDVWDEDDSGDHIVQGTFGDYFPTEDKKVQGFINIESRPYTLAPDAVIELPNEAGVNVAADFETLMNFEASLAAQDPDMTFCCEFELNGDGILTKLVYVGITKEILGMADRSVEYNPVGYTMLKVRDAWLCEDGDYVVSACFGDFSFEDETMPASIGFEEPDYTLVIARDALIEMPADLQVEDNEVMTLDQFMDLIDNARNTTENLYFYCEFLLDYAGELTQLSYYFMPF